MLNKTSLILSYLQQTFLLCSIISLCFICIFSIKTVLSGAAYVLSSYGRALPSRCLDSFCWGPDPFHPRPLLRPDLLRPVWPPDGLPAAGSEPETTPTTRCRCENRWIWQLDSEISINVNAMKLFHLYVSFFPFNFHLPASESYLDVAELLHGVHRVTEDLALRVAGQHQTLRHTRVCSSTTSTLLFCLQKAEQSIQFPKKIKKFKS